jgi:hypothetical protein
MSDAGKSWGFINLNDTTDKVGLGNARGFDVHSITMLSMSRECSLCLLYIVSQPLETVLQSKDIVTVKAWEDSVVKCKEAVESHVTFNVHPFTFYFKYVLLEVLTD